MKAFRLVFSHEKTDTTLSGKNKRGFEFNGIFVVFAIHGFEDNPSRVDSVRVGFTPALATGTELPIDRRQILHPPDRNLQQIVLPHTHTHERQQRLRLELPSKG